MFYIIPYQHSGDTAEGGAERMWGPAGTQLWDMSGYDTAIGLMNSQQLWSLAQKSSQQTQPHSTGKTNWTQQSFFVCWFVWFGFRRGHCAWRNEKMNMIKMGFKNMYEIMKEQIKDTLILKDGGPQNHLSHLAFKRLMSQTEKECKKTKPFPYIPELRGRIFWQLVILRPILTWKGKCFVSVLMNPKWEGVTGPLVSILNEMNLAREIQD